jgi:hypothetical protein
MGPVLEVVFEFYKETRQTISAHMSYGNSSTLVRHRPQSTHTNRVLRLSELNHVRGSVVGCQR